MIIRLLLTGSLAAILTYFVLTSRRPSVVGYGVGLGAVSGIFFVWQPDRTTRIATFIGVGRGADMIFYSWLVISFALFLNNHIRQRRTLEMVTQLSREVAILTAVRPPG